MLWKGILIQPGVSQQPLPSEISSSGPADCAMAGEYEPAVETRRRDETYVQAHAVCWRQALPNCAGVIDLLLKATRGVTIAVVSSRERKRRQPGLATDDPAFVGWHQLVRGIQGS